MKAAVFHDLGAMRIDDVETPTCADDEMLIKVMACGVCGSDLRIFKHGNPRVKPPAILGHEVAGVVAAKGENVGPYKIGDRVAMGADVPCGQCDYCQQGFCNNCDENLAIGYQYAGGFAEYMKVDRRVWEGGPLAVIPDHLSFTEAAVAEPLGCAINGIEILPNRKKESILIFGAGVLGNLLAQLAKVSAYEKVFVTDIVPEKLAMAKELNIPADTLLPLSDGFTDRIMKLTKGRGADAVIVACADPDAQRLAIDVTAKRGAVNLFAGLGGTAKALSFSPNVIHYREIFLTGSHGSTPTQHRRALDLIAEGRIKVKNLITQTFPLQQIAEAFSAIESNRRFKVMITPNG